MYSRTTFWETLLYTVYVLEKRIHRKNDRKRCCHSSDIGFRGFNIVILEPQKKKKNGTSNSIVCIKGKSLFTVRFVAFTIHAFDHTNDRENMAISQSKSLRNRTRLEGDAIKTSFIVSIPVALVRDCC